MLSKREMLDKLNDYSGKIKDLIARSGVPDKEVFDAMRCSPYSGDEWTEFKVTHESIPYGVQEFTYKGFIFKITAIIHEDRFVCWLEQHEDKSYLENVYLVPGAWIWGMSVDDKDIETIFLPAIDKYLQEVGTDNIK